MRIFHLLVKRVLNNGKLIGYLVAFINPNFRQVSQSWRSADMRDNSPYVASVAIGIKTLFAKTGYSMKRLGQSPYG
jgi:hypothetical protein